VLLLRASLRIGLRGFFAVTSLLLVLFSAGLVANGLHELTEAGVIPPLAQPLWDMNPPVRADGSYPALHDQGSAGGVLRGLFGYFGAPSLIELGGWAVTLAAAAGLCATAGRGGRSGERPGDRRR
jgi:high-affinity iron transporter